jgi:hypothetical protein
VVNAVVLDRDRRQCRRAPRGSLLAFGCVFLGTHIDNGGPEVSKGAAIDVPGLAATVRRATHTQTRRRKRLESRVADCSPAALAAAVAVVTEPVKRGVELDQVILGVRSQPGELLALGSDR